MSEEPPPIPTPIKSILTQLQELRTTRQSLERVRMLVENSRDLVAEVTAQGQLLYVSPMVKKVLGYEPNELLLTTVFQHIHPEDVTGVQAQFAAREGWAAARCKHKDGSWRSLEISCRSVFASAGQTGSVMVLRDAAPRRPVMEIKLPDPGSSAAARKLQVEPALAIRLAGDLNNILTVISTYTDLADLDAGKAAETRQHLDEIRAALERARQLTRQLTEVP